MWLGHGARLSSGRDAGTPSTTHQVPNCHPWVSAELMPGAEGGPPSLKGECLRSPGTTLLRNFHTRFIPCTTAGGHFHRTFTGWPW